MEEISNPEFDLHVWKRPGIGGRPDVYTIGVWEDQRQIRSLCHIASIDEAVAVVRQTLESAMRSTPVKQRR